MNIGYDSIGSAAGRPAYGYEQAAARLGEVTKRMEEQLARLEVLAGPILENLPPSPPVPNGVASPGYACDLLRALGNRTDGVWSVSDKLESIINRIRL